MTKNNPLAQRIGKISRNSVNDPDLTIQHLKIENELLLSSLINTQEDLEKSKYEITLKENTIDSLKSKLNKLYAKFPNYWHADSINLSIIKNDLSCEILHWEVTGVTLSGREHTFLALETSYKNGITGLKILNSSSGFDYFRKTPLVKFLDFTPTASTGLPQQIKTLSEIGTSDWKSIVELVEKLAGHLCEDGSSELPEEFCRNQHIGLIKLREILQQWPNTLRFDHVSATDQIITKEYQSLELSISNLYLNGKTYPNFCYRISSVNEPGQPFGQHPRLEFNEKSISYLENWFAESADDRGQRLELRFAEPDQMDLNVWSKLSKHDQIAIAANISRLPDMIASIKNIDESKLPSNAWKMLSIAMKNILTKTVQNQRNRMTTNV